MSLYDILTDFNGRCQGTGCETWTDLTEAGMLTERGAGRDASGTSSFASFDFVFFLWETKVVRWVGGR
jgi:hypothetical protein